MMQVEKMKIYELEDLFSEDDLTVSAYDYKTHEICLSDGCKCRLPLQTNVNQLKVEFLEDKPFLILIVQSGGAVMGLVEEGELTYHKVFRGYLIRKKQGKSQLKHLKTKGKSRAGSRVRLSSTFSFLDDICQKLQDVFLETELERIVFHCSDLLRPHFFERNKCFDKNDERLFPLGVNVDAPSYEFLERLLDRFSSAYYYQ